MNDNQRAIDDWLSQLEGTGGPSPETVPQDNQPPVHEEQEEAHIEEELPIVTPPVTEVVQFEDEDLDALLQARGMTTEDNTEAQDVPGAAHISYNGVDMTVTPDYWENTHVQSGNTESASISMLDDNPTQPTEEDEEEDNEEIPENTQFDTPEKATSRFSGAEWFKLMHQQVITLAGLGGIGSNVAYQVARLAPRRIMLWDNDFVEEVNMAGQMYGYPDLGDYKAKAVRRVLREFTNINTIFVNEERFTVSSPITDIAICGFDNMEARKIFFNNWKERLGCFESSKKGFLFIDGRLSFDTFQVLCMTGDDSYNIQRYQDEFLFPSSEAMQTICSVKQTTYLACMIASVITNLLVNHVANLTDPVLPYRLPFFTQYNAQNMIYKIEM